MKGIKITEPRITKLEERDIPGLIELSASVGWDYDRDEIKTIMSSGKVYGHKNQEGKIISSAAIIEYSSKLASIGMVIVNQEYRGMGLGRKATQKCLDSVSKNTTCMLIATEDGKPMYEKMGFNSTAYVHKYLCDSYLFIKSDSNFHTELMREEDLSQIIKIDKDAFGVERRTFLINRINQAKEALVVKNQNGTIIGYGLSILGPVNLILGPIVAPNHETAFLLVHKLMRNHQGRFRIDVPSGNDVFMSHLEECGFVKVSQPPIMIKNPNQLPPRNKMLYGIAAQIFG